MFALKCDVIFPIPAPQREEKDEGDTSHEERESEIPGETSVPQRYVSSSIINA